MLPHYTQQMGRSRPVAGTGYLGPIPDEIWEVLIKAWDRPISIQSNYSREHSVAVAFSASMGWLSSIQPDGLGFSRKWHITLEGLTALRTSTED